MTPKTLQTLSRIWEEMSHANRRLFEIRTGVSAPTGIQTEWRRTRKPVGR